MNLPRGGKVALQKMAEREQSPHVLAIAQLSGRFREPHGFPAVGASDRGLYRREQRSAFVLQREQ